MKIIAFEVGAIAAIGGIAGTLEVIPMATLAILLCLVLFVVVSFTVTVMVLFSIREALKNLERPIEKMSYSVVEAMNASRRGDSPRGVAQQ